MRSCCLPRQFRIRPEGITINIGNTKACLIMTVTLIPVLVEDDIQTEEDGKFALHVVLWTSRLSVLFLRKPGVTDGRHGRYMKPLVCQTPARYSRD